MSVRGIKLRVDDLESAAGINVPRVRVVFVEPHEDRAAALAAADVKHGEMPIVVSFVAAATA